MGLLQIKPVIVVGWAETRHPLNKRWVVIQPTRTNHHGFSLLAISYPNLVISYFIQIHKFGKLHLNPD